MNEPTPSYRVSLVGDSGCGKTCLFNMLRGEDFMNDDNVSTIGVDFWVKKFANPPRSLQIWDTAGQEKFLSVVQIYFRRCNLAIYCCDVTNISSLEAIVRWRDEVHHQLVNKDNHEAIIIGLKTDLTDKRVVSTDMIGDVAMTLGIDHYFEISNKTGEGHKALKEYLIKIPIEKFEHHRTVQTPRAIDSRKENSCC